MFLYSNRYSNKIPSSIFNSSALIHLLYHLLSTMGPTCQDFFFFFSPSPPYPFAGSPFSPASLYGGGGGPAPAAEEARPSGGRARARPHEGGATTPAMAAPTAGGAPRPEQRRRCGSIHGAAVVRRRFGEPRPVVPRLQHSRRWSFEAEWQWHPRARRGAKKKKRPARRGGTGSAVMASVPSTALMRSRPAPVRPRAHVERRLARGGGRGSGRARRWRAWRP